MTYSIIDATKGLLRGDTILTSQQTAKHRLDICKQCDAYNKTIHVCTVCKCFMPAKTRLEQAVCPMELW